LLKGILRVYAKARPTIANRPEVEILDRQVLRFQRELLAAEAREAIETGDFPRATERLAALQRERGGAVLGIARVAARWAPGLLSRAYHVRRRMVRA
jgi:hypothetical protein